MGLVIERQASDWRLISPTFVRHTQSKVLVIDLTVNAVYPDLLDNLLSYPPSSRAERVRHLAKLGSVLEFGQQNGPVDTLGPGRFLNASTAGSPTPTDTQPDHATQSAGVTWPDGVTRAGKNPPAQPATTSETMAGSGDNKDGERRASSGIVRGMTAKQPRKRGSLIDTLAETAATT